MSKNNKQTGPGQAIGLFTDLEPDDVLAIGVLAARGFACALCVVGEGNPAAKVPRAGAYLEAAGMRPCSAFPTTQVLAGCPSTKLFPGEKPPTAEEGPVASFDVAAFASTLEECVDAGVRTLVCLKPPTELYALLTHMPEAAYRLLSVMRLVLYGSFNIRQLAAAGAKTNSAATALLNADVTPFASVVLYESYGGTAEGCSNINPTTCPALFAHTAPDEPLPGQLGAVMRQWDEDILRDCDETCAACEEAKDAGDPEAVAKWGRNNSCRLAVRANFARQFVAADAVLAALLDNDAAAECLQAVRVDFGVMPYPATTVLYSPPEAHKLWKYIGVPWAVIAEQLARVVWF